MQKSPISTYRKAVIAISCSLVIFIIFGTIKLNAQLFLTVREKFGVDRKQGSLPFILLFTVRNLSGPFVGYLGNKFGLRCVTVFGCLLSSVSIGACFLVEDIIPFTILWGIGFGIGFGLGTILLANILHLYFTKNFNLVCGIFIAAGSLGSFTLPGIGEYLLGTYGTSGTFLILSGLILNTVPAALLLKCPENLPDVESHLKVTETDGESFEMSEQIKTSEELKCPRNPPYTESQLKFTETGESFGISEQIKTSGAQNVSNCVCRSNSEMVNSEDNNFHLQDAVCDVYSLSNIGSVKDTHGNKMCQKYSRDNIPSHNLTIEKGKAFPDLSQVNDAKSKDAVKVCDFENDSIIQRDNQIGSDGTILSRNKKAEENPGVPSKRNKSSTGQITEKNCVNSNEVVNPNSIEHLNSEDIKPNKINVEKNPNFISRNLQVFFDPAYILILISVSVVVIPVTVLSTVMVDACRDKGITEDVTILMTFAIADMFGAPVFGHLADTRCIRPLNIYALTCGSYGLLLIGFTWLSGFYVVVVFFAVAGALVGGLNVLPIIRDYIEKENLTMAFSSRFFLFGLLNLSQPFVIGYFRETLQSYDGLFYFFGSMCIFGSVVALFVPSAARYRDRRKNEKKETEKLLA